MDLLKMYFLLRMAIFQPAMLVYQRLLASTPPESTNGWNPQNRWFACRCFSFSKGGIFRFHASFWWCKWCYSKKPQVYVMCIGKIICRYMMCIYINTYSRIYNLCLTCLTEFYLIKPWVIVSPLLSVMWCLGLRNGHSELDISGWLDDDICYDRMILYDRIWYYMVGWYDMIWHDMIWYFRSLALSSWYLPTFNCWQWTSQSIHGREDIRVRLYGGHLTWEGL